MRRRPGLRRALRVRASEPEPTADRDGAALQALTTRLERLEKMVEGLQDALYRQALSQDERIDELARKTEPEEMARALSEDSRRRGL